MKLFGFGGQQQITERPAATAGAVGDAENALPNDSKAAATDALVKPTSGSKAVEGDAHPSIPTSSSSAVEEVASQARAEVGGDGSSIAKLEDAELSSVDAAPPAGDSSSESPKSRDVEPPSVSPDGSVPSVPAAPNSRDEADGGSVPQGNAGPPTTGPPVGSKGAKGLPPRSGPPGRHDPHKAPKVQKPLPGAGEYVTRILGAKNRTAVEIESENRKLRAELISCRKSLVASQDALECYNDAVSSISSICAAGPPNAAIRIQAVIDALKSSPAEGQRRSSRKKLWKRVASTTPQSETPQSAAAAERRKVALGVGGSKAEGPLSPSLYHGHVDAHQSTAVGPGSALSSPQRGRRRRANRTRRSAPAQQTPQPPFGEGTGGGQGTRTGRSGRRMQDRIAIERPPPRQDEQTQTIGDSVRASLRAANSIEVLSGVIKKAKGCGLTYEAELGQKKLDKLAAAQPSATFDFGAPSVVAAEVAMAGA